MPGACQLLCGCETCRTATNHCNRLAGKNTWGYWSDPTHLECVVDDGYFNLFDSDRVLVDSQDACPFAGGGAQASSELGEVVRCV